METVIVYRLSSASTPTSTRKVMAGSGSVSKSSGNAAAFGRTYLRTTGAENTPPPPQQKERKGERVCGQGAESLRTPARKSVVEGKRVSVRVDLGGRRVIKKKK